MYPKTSSPNFLIIQQIRGYARPLTMPFISHITPQTEEWNNSSVIVRFKWPLFRQLQLFG